MKSIEPTKATITAPAEHEIDLSEFERHVQLSEFVPNPFWLFGSTPKSPSPLVVLID